MLERVLDDAFRLETDIAEYSNGATAHIKRALQNSSNVEIQNEVFQIVCSFVARIKAYYELAQRIEQVNKIFFVLNLVIIWREYIATLLHLYYYFSLKRYFYYNIFIL